MRLYLDASILVPAFVTEDQSAAVTALLLSLSAPPLISDFACGEFASAIARRVRMGLLSADDAHQILADFDIRVPAMGTITAITPGDIAVATGLVRRFALKLQLPDAIHLALCQRSGLVLATLDAGLAGAANALAVTNIVPA